MSETFLTAADVAQLLQLNQETVYSLAKREQLPGVKIAGQWRFLESEIYRWFRSRCRVMAEPCDELEIDTAETAEQEREPEPLDVQEVKVLVADDCEIDREHLRRILGAHRKIHFSLEEAVTGSSTLIALQKRKPDLLLLDYLLPDLDALELLEKVAAIPGSDVIGKIVLTAQGCERVAVSSLQRGADDYLTKREISADNLIRAITYTLERKKLLVLLQEKQRLVEETLLLAEQAHDGREQYFSNANRKVHSAIEEIQGKIEEFSHEPLDRTQGAKLKSIQEMTSSLLSELSCTTTTEPCEQMHPAPPRPGKVSRYSYQGDT